MTEKDHIKEMKENKDAGKHVAVNTNVEHKHEAPAHEHAAGEKHDHEHKHDAKTETKADDKKKAPKVIHVKKEEAVAISNGLHISMKQSMDVCKFIKNKKIDEAMYDLERVAKLKMPVPMKGEIPHRKGRIMAGRYPINTAKAFIGVLKALKGNSIVNGLSLDITRVVYASPNSGYRPAKSGGRYAKRVNLILKAREVIEGKKHG